MPAKFAPARYGLLFEFFAAPDDGKPAAFFTFINRERQSPITVGLADKPVVHVSEPVQFPLESKRRSPGNLFCGFLHLLPETKLAVRSF